MNERNTTRHTLEERSDVTRLTTLLIKAVIPKSYELPVRIEGGECKAKSCEKILFEWGYGWLKDSV